MIAIFDMQYGHSFSVGSAAGASSLRLSLLMLRTSINTAKATIKKLITALKKKAVVNCYGAGCFCIRQRCIGSGRLGPLF